MKAGLLDHNGRPFSRGRQAQASQVRRYDAASYTSRFSTWLPGTYDADVANTDPVTLRNRAHELARNNPWAVRYLQVVVSNMIADGIVCSIRARSKARAKRVQDLWQAWAGTTACDATGRNNFYGLQQVMCRAIAESGEVLVRQRPRRPEDRLPIPMQLQVIEAEYLVETPITVASGNTVLRGIEYDGIGRRVAYHLYKTHPGAMRMEADARDITRVPADEILHIYWVNRPGQERGVTWLAPIATTLRDIDIYEQAYLRRQQIANLFAGFIMSQNPNDMLDELEEEIPDLQPGTMYGLRAGTEIQFTNPPPAGEDPAYRNSCLRRVAAGGGVSYEALTGDLSQVNFSSARMGAQEMGRNLDAWQWLMFIPIGCDGVLRWFLDVAGMSLGIDTSDMRGEWTTPRRVQVDPYKETDALLLSCRSGFKSVPEAIRELGYDPVLVAEENAEYFKLLESMGLQIEANAATGKAPAAAQAANQNTDSTTQANGGN